MSDQWQSRAPSGPPAVPPQFQQNAPWQQQPPQYPQSQPYQQPQQYRAPGQVVPYVQPQPAWQQPQYYAPRVTPKSTGTGLLLGLLFPGVGCMYAGRTAIGIAILAGWLISIPLVFVAGIGFFTGLAAWILSAVLGYTFTRDWNTARGIAS